VSQTSAPDGAAGRDVTAEEPDSTAVRTALWRALHVEIDPPPHVFSDEIGVRLVAPEAGWRQRRDMNPPYTSRARASIVARARFIEDLVVEQAGQGVGQYVLLGAGVDTFAQRRPEIGSKLDVFEVDLPGPQAWKRRRLAEEGFDTPDWLHFVAVDFEGPWWDQLGTAGFDAGRPAVVASSGVVMYLSKEATAATLVRLAGLAAGSTLAASFMVPSKLVEPSEQRAIAGARKGMQAAAGSVSLFTPEEMVAMARHAGFAKVRHVAAAELTELYFSGRSDGLRPSSAEELVVAAT
jgi:methyltransferase (TIGR00027 family)